MRAASWPVYLLTYRCMTPYSDQQVSVMFVFLRPRMAKILSSTATYLHLTHIILGLLLRYSAYLHIALAVVCAFATTRTCRAQPPTASLPLHTTTPRPRSIHFHLVILESLTACLTNNTVRMKHIIPWRQDNDTILLLGPICGRASHKPCAN
jgi:hypothetical protein